MQHRSAANATQQKYGENLYWASARRWSDGTVEVQQVSPEKVVLSWASEKKNYSLTSNSCQNGKICGHYTQIVWKQSKIVGCGRAFCEDKSQVWVCNYHPPGNVVGQSPYWRFFSDKAEWFVFIFHFPMLSYEKKVSILFDNSTTAWYKISKLKVLQPDRPSQNWLQAFLMALQLVSPW